MELTNIGIGLAFLAGIASFLSPCVFALVPAYIGYLGGRSVAHTSGEGVNRWQTLSHAIFFVLGFSLVFIILGVTTSVIGGWLYDMRVWLARIGGIVVIIFGVHMTGLVRIPFLEIDLRVHSAPARNRGYLSSLLMGIFFSAGWSPCVGPILGTILTLVLNGASISYSVILLSAYSLGLGIPFLFAAMQISLIAHVIRRYGKLMRAVEIFMGVVLIMVGGLLFSGQFVRLASLGTFFSSYDELALGRLLFAIFFSLLILAILPAMIAARKGRNFWDWWFFGIGLFPVALIMAVLLESTIPQVHEEAK